jgi:hypothetical protein
VYLICLINLSSSSIHSSLLSALSKSNDKNAPLRADGVFEQMLSSGVQADTVAWTILITIWSRSKLKNKEERVQEIFERSVCLIVNSNVSPSIFVQIISYSIL